MDEKRAPEADLRSVPGNTTQHTTTALCINPTHNFCVCARSIFDDVGDYIVSTSSSSSKPSKDKERHRERDRDDDSKSRRHTHSYFEKPRGDEHQVTLPTHKNTRRRLVFEEVLKSVSVFLSVCRHWKLIQVTDL